MEKVNELSSEPITALFSWNVKQGKEQEFQQLVHELDKAERKFRGHLGITTLKNPARKNNFQIIIRFDCTKHLDDWLNSPVRKKLIKPLEAIAEASSFKEATGLETWFDIPGQQVSLPPRWKIVVTTFIAIYPLSLLYGLFVATNIATWPVELRALVLPAFAPVLLTYILMPFLTQHVLKGWLYKANV